MPRRLGIAGLLVLAAALCAYFARFEPIDDAYISYRYAENFVAGHGLVYNVGERVEGYTNFLWVVLLCPFAWLGLDLEAVSRLLGAFFALGTVLALESFAVRDAERPWWGTLVAPGLWVTSLPPLLWAVHGLETAMFGFLLAMAFRADLRAYAGESVRPVSAVWFALATLTRPEAALLFGARVALGVALDGRGWLRRGAWVHAGWFVAIVAPLFAARLLYYGYPLPNTFYAKTGLSGLQFQRGLAYVTSFFGGWNAPLALAVLPALRDVVRDRRLTYAYAMLALHLVIVVLEGGDAFPGYRFVVPAAAMLYFLVQESAWLLVRAVAPTRRLHATAVALSVLAALLLAQAHQLSTAVYEEAYGAHRFTTRMKLVGRSLREHLPASARIAVNPAGALPYVTGMYAYDMLGLTDAHIAHRPVPDFGSGKAGHERGDGRYVLEQRPDVILIGNVHVRSEAVDPASIQWRGYHRSEREILAAPDLGEHYVADSLPLADGRIVYFLRRRDVELLE